MSNPGSTGSADAFDGVFTATDKNLAAGAYAITFATDAADRGAAAA